VRSFNPCFPGSSAESVAEAFKSVDENVSILVFLDQALKVPPGLFLSGAFPVSILVFLDQALKVQPFHFYLIFPSVSILVFLDQALKAFFRLYTGASQILFQSLFSWIKR